MDIPQQCGYHFPGNADAADVPQNAPPSSNRHSVPIQPHGHAGVVHNAVSLTPSSPHEDSYWCIVFSFLRRMLAIIGHKGTGWVYPHQSKTLLHKANHNTCSSLTWAIIIWLMISLRYMSTAVLLSTTMLGLLWRFLPRAGPRPRPPHQPL